MKRPVSCKSKAISCRSRRSAIRSGSSCRMSEPEWLDTTIVLDVHAEQLALFGGADGIRDLGLLESALGRPLNKFTYGETNLAALAAAYAFGIARNHPF